MGYNTKLMYRVRLGENSQEQQLICSFINMFQSVIKMSLLGPVCLDFLLVLIIEGTYAKERVVQLSREKRDVDMLVACDEHCLPEDEIKDYDILLQYDEDPDPTPGPFLYDFEKKSCAFACKIVDMNQTKALNDILGGEFTITSVEELPNGYGVSNFNPLTTMVGLRKNVTFSPSIRENVTIKSELLNETSSCFCPNNSTHTNETTTPVPKLIDKNATESTLKPNKSSIFVNNTQENFIANGDFTENNVTSETTTENQQLRVIPVIPKVIRYTIVEAEMAEAGVTAAPNVEKTQEKNYFDDNNNASLVLKTLLENLAQHGGQGSEGILENLGLGNLNKYKEKPIIIHNITSTIESTKGNRITDEVTAAQPIPPHEHTFGPIESTTINHVITDPIGNASVTTETKLNNLNQNSLNKEATLLQTKNFTNVMNETQSKEDISKVTLEKLPRGLEQPSTSNNISNEMTKNATYSNSSDSKISYSKQTDLLKLPSANLTSPDNSTEFHNENHSLENLKWPNITDYIYGDHSNTRNPSSTLSQDLQKLFPSTGFSNVTDISMYNKTVGNGSYLPPNLHHEANNTEAKLNKTTSLHKIR